MQYRERLDAAVVFDQTHLPEPVHEETEGCKSAALDVRRVSLTSRLRKNTNDAKIP